MNTHEEVTKQKRKDPPPEIAMIEVQQFLTTTQ
jgi:DNA-directed RNA polymerase subunit K/omega